MTDIQIFDVEGYGIRFGVSQDGRPYSVAADYAKAMSYARTQNATDLLDEDEKGYAIVVTPGGPQRLAVIYEDGMWELIFRSTLPGAKAIKKRVKAILRQIRETGSYSTAPTPAELTRRDLARMVIEEADRADAAELRALELAEPAQAWEALAEAAGDYSVRDAAQILNRDPNITTGQNRLFRTLHEVGWTDAKGRPYQAQVDSGRLVRRTTSYTHPHSGEPVLSSQIRITIKGVEALRKHLGGDDGGLLFAVTGGA